MQTMYRSRRQQFLFSSLSCISQQSCVFFSILICHLSAYLLLALLIHPLFHSIILSLIEFFTYHPFITLICSFVCICPNLFTHSLILIDKQTYTNLLNCLAKSLNLIFSTPSPITSPSLSFPAYTVTYSMVVSDKPVSAK